METQRHGNLPSEKISGKQYITNAIVPPDGSMDLIVLYVSVVKLS
jgi:hypothetical protein